MEKVVIIDYGMSNLHSVFSALNEVSNGQFDIQISQDHKDIENADKVVFPGQGAAADCMKQINSLRLIEPIKKAAAEKPFLGICMGMQVLLEYSDENNGTDCLGLIKGSVNAFLDSYAKANIEGLKIPHMGWNTIDIVKASPLLKDFDEEPRFYFAHSYHAVCDNTDAVLATTHHGYDLPVVFAQDNIYGAQFHPEKSHKFGMQLLKNFAGMEAQK